MLRCWYESIHWNFILAACLRLVLLVYGLWQDKVMAVGYTDIDYTVFTDAARYVNEGLSPYRRATYRYTPILAILLQGNITLCASFGKLLFILCDLLVGYFIYRSVEKTGVGGRRAITCTQLWLFNPLTLVVSTRGNAESLIASLIVGMLFLLRSGGRWQTVLGALLYGLSVHIKIYPVIYVLALYLFINITNAKRISPNDSISSYWFHCICPTVNSVLFGLISLITFVAVSGACYVWYGDEFVYNTYLYHVTRRDIRHNFSVYFYFIYLTSSSSVISSLLAFLAFAPQMLLVLVVSLKFHQDIEFTTFLLTFIFVTFNKVCTSQYFTWYLCLLPLIVTNVKRSQIKEYIHLFVLWLIAQGVWLLPAYVLEFHGYNVFIFIWLGGLTFFTVNVYVVCKIILLYRPPKCI